MTGLAQLADDLVDVQLDRFPTAASLLGRPGRDHLLPDYSDPAEAAYSVARAWAAIHRSRMA
ncbi:hypothetical protein [Amycolatopsis jiangsuensis]|uniref:HEPN domain-containing protein n=1 Tax=Amycolatopsis jiangsuensis TaxID=1181879 RepID=A0A840J5E8_9PSEU|nr:hypothetical protein [Amycolatopsis jiangsuensis]MBB4688614.1 hypothetical protein [Amycolatopsis jiangsuensis]